jgi:hypothetical protein
MKNVFHHVVIPSIVPMVFFTLTAIPVDLIGCLNRGLMAVGIALMGGLLGVGAAARGAAAKARRNPIANWWLGTALILAIPALFILAIEA